MLPTPSTEMKNIAREVAHQWATDQAAHLRILLNEDVLWLKSICQYNNSTHLLPEWTHYGHFKNIHHQPHILHTNHNLNIPDLLKQIDHTIHKINRFQAIANNTQ